MAPAASWASGGPERFDADGALAGRGTVSEPLLARLKAQPYYRLPPPRSTGRELFNAGYLRAMRAGPDPAPPRPDVAATVTRLLVDLLAAAGPQHGLTQPVLAGPGTADRATARGQDAA